MALAEVLTTFRENAQSLYNTSLFPESFGEIENYWNGLFPAVPFRDLNCQEVFSRRVQSYEFTEILAKVPKSIGGRTLTNRQASLGSDTKLKFETRAYTLWNQINHCEDPITRLMLKVLYVLSSVIFLPFFDWLSGLANSQMELRIVYEKDIEPFSDRGCLDLTYKGGVINGVFFGENEGINAYARIKETRAKDVFARTSSAIEPNATDQICEMCFVTAVLLSIIV